MSGGEADRWAHSPELPIEVSPLFRWPIRPLEVLRWFWGSWFWLSEKLVILGVAWACWAWAAPPPETAATLAPGWILAVWARNIALMCLVAGGLHWWFYRRRGQGDRLRHDTRDISKGGVFTFKRQVWDNVFWTLTSGVTVWTAYEVLLLHAFARGWLAPLGFAASPVWFVALFFLIPIWESFYFYWIHRALHWRPLYRLAHHVHHRNTNIGPWSGLSMHPVEHVIYLGGVLIHGVIASHPAHVLFHLQYYCLSAVTTHSGFEGLVVQDRKRMAMGTFHHQMHHRYFECNYGSLEIPWDQLFGSFHDGSEAGRAQMAARRKRLAGKLGG